MRASVPLIVTFLLLGTLSTLSGCGLKGELYLPEEPPAAHSGASPAAQDEDEAGD